MTIATTRSASPSPARSPDAASERPRPLRLGFLGLGWIGRARLSALAKAVPLQEVAVYDPCAEACGQAAEATIVCGCAGELLDRDLDGVVIATPNMLHEDQCLAAIDRGLPVFCQKPLAPTPTAARRIVDAARRRDVLLAVDWSYRHLDGVARVLELVRRGELGDLVAIDLTFHNAWGPDGAWFYDRSLAGGGCLVDLGVHLLDLALRLTPGDLCCEAARVTAGGRPVAASPHSPLEKAPVENFALAMLRADAGPTVRLACSWEAHLGRACEIAIDVHGTSGGASIRNVGGSFFDFRTHRHDGVRTTPLAEDDGSWGGRALAEWARGVAAGAGYDPDAERAARVMELVDEIYRTGAACGS